MSPRKQASYTHEIFRPSKYKSGSGTSLYPSYGPIYCQLHTSISQHHMRNSQKKEKKKKKKSDKLSTISLCKVYAATTFETDDGKSK